MIAEAVEEVGEDIGCRCEAIHFTYDDETDLLFLDGMDQGGEGGAGDAVIIRGCPAARGGVALVVDIRKDVVKGDGESMLEGELTGMAFLFFDRVCLMGLVLAAGSYIDSSLHEGKVPGSGKWVNPGVA